MKNWQNKFYIKTIINENKKFSKHRLVRVQRFNFFFAT